MGNLRDRVAVITGASSGLGEAMAHRFASAGASVVVNYRGNEAGATAAVAAIRANGGQAVVHQADVTRSEDADGLIARAVQEFGRLDILVNNAGMRQDALILRMKEQDWQAVLTTNPSPLPFSVPVRRSGRWCASVMAASSTLPPWLESPGTSARPTMPRRRLDSFGLTRATAREVATRGITANVLAPGFFPTRMTADVTEEMREFLMSQIPMGRWGDPSETAAAAAFLVSDDAAYITGQVLNVDGGLVMA